MATFHALNVLPRYCGKREDARWRCGCIEERRDACESSSRMPVFHAFHAGCAARGGRGRSHMPNNHGRWWDLWLRLAKADALQHACITFPALLLNFPPPHHHYHTTFHACTLISSGGIFGCGWLRLMPPRMLCTTFPPFPLNSPLLPTTTIHTCTQAP
eukprot:366292-Chlamydomonas_euryale.AAC.3